MPILNVSDVEASFAWFGKLGWCSSSSGMPTMPRRLRTSAGCDGCEIFLCGDGQGSRGRGANTQAGGLEATSERTRAWVSMVDPGRQGPGGA